VVNLLGGKIKELREKLNLTQQDLADKLNIGQSTIGMIESDKRIPGRKTLTKLATFFGVSLDYLLKDENVEEDFETIDISTQFVPIPIVGEIRAGELILAEENLQGYMPVLRNSLKLDGEYFALKVKGDSMNLEFNEGSILIIEKTCCIENGQIGVVRVDGIEATVKKIVINNGMITLIPMSTNPVHIPRMYNIRNDDVEVIGIVKQAIKSY
jgi:repressor LexA